MIVFFPSNKYKSTKHNFGNWINTWCCLDVFRDFSFSKMILGKTVTHRKFLSEHTELFGHQYSVSVGRAGLFTDLFGRFYSENDFCVLLRQKSYTQCEFPSPIKD